MNLKELKGMRIGDLTEDRKEDERRRGRRSEKSRNSSSPSPVPDRPGGDRLRRGVLEVLPTATGSSAPPTPTTFRVPTTSTSLPRRSAASACARGTPSADRSGRPKGRAVLRPPEGREGQLRRSEISKDKILFDNLTPLYPQEKFTMEYVNDNYATRIIDLIAPIGKGQRALITSRRGREKRSSSRISRTASPRTTPRRS